MITLLFFCLSVIGQNNFKEGYVITNSGDTIRGQIDFITKSKMYKLCRFNNDGNIIEYTSNDLRAYVINDQRFFASNVAKGSFVEVLVRGKISLYRKNNSFYVKKNEKVYQLKKYREKEEDGHSYEIEDNRWRGIIYYLIKDELEKDIDPKNFSFTEKFFTKLLRKYNTIKGKQYVAIKKDLVWKKSNYGVIGGIKYETLNINDKQDKCLFLDPNYSMIVPYIGLFMNTCYPGISDQLSFQVEVLYSQMKISSTKMIENNKYPEYFDNYFDLIKLSFPISIKYSFPLKNKIQWYLQLGGVVDYNIKSDYTRFSESVANSVVETKQSNDLDMNSMQLGIVGGIGLIKEFKKFKGGIGLHYSRVNNLVEESFVNINQDRILFSITISKK